MTAASFESETKPNILAFQESQGMNADAVTSSLNLPIREAKSSEYLIEEIDHAEIPLLTRKKIDEDSAIAVDDVASLLALFKYAKTFGSLIQVPASLAKSLSGIERRLQAVLDHGDLEHASARAIEPLLQQAKLLSDHYDVVVANPPYMGDKYFSEHLKHFVSHNYQPGKADLYACFILRNSSLAKVNGLVGMITIPNWMFISSFEELRSSLLDEQTFDSFIYNGRGVFGSDFGSCTFTFRKCSMPKYKAAFRRLFDKQGSVASNEELEIRFRTASNQFASALDFRKLPGSPLSFWASEGVRSVFETSPSLKDVSATKKGMATADNDRFVRCWWEVSFSKCGFGFTREEAQKSR